MAVNSELDELLSADQSAPVVEENQQSVEQTQTQQNRGDDGRFVAKSTTVPVSEEQVQPQPQPDAQPQNGGVPVRAVQDERERRQAAQQENEGLKQQLAALQGQIDLLMRHGQQPQPQEQQRPASLWDDPDAYLQGQLNPVQSQLQETREMLLELQASQTHGADKVVAAKKAAEALFGTPAGKALAQQITASGNMFDNLVKWHQQQETLSRVGNDPEAWLQAELERRLADPAEQAKILERIRSGAPSTQNNGKPITNFAPSLSRMPSGGNQAPDNDMSDSALFNFATSR